MDLEDKFLAKGMILILLLYLDSEFGFFAPSYFCIDFVVLRFWHESAK